MILHAITHVNIIYALYAGGIFPLNKSEVVYADALTKQIACPSVHCSDCALGVLRTPVTANVCYHNFMEFMRTHAPEVLDKYPECFL